MNEGGVRIILLKPMEAGSVRAAESVNGLFGIANQEKTIIGRIEHLGENIILQRIGILEFID